MEQRVQVISGPLEGLTLALENDGELSLGRGPQNAVVLGFDPCLSTNHAILRRSAGKLKIMDLGSSNGTFMEGKKIKPSEWYFLSDFFVLGSSIFRMGEVLAVPEASPLPAGQFQPGPEQQNLFQAACQFANECKHGVIHSSHIFWSLVQAFPQDAKTFFNRIALNQNELLQRWHNGRYFDSNFRWMNDFLRFQMTTVPVKSPLLTPLSQFFFRRCALKKAAEFQSMVDLLLEGKSCFLHEMLDWEKSRSRLHPSTQGRTRMTTGVPISGRPLILPERFWKDLSQVVGQNKLVVLAGSKGCGKTTIIQKVFHPITEVPLASSLAEEPMLYDSRVFLVFNPAKSLGFYLEKIRQSLLKPGLVGIDHFGHLLSTMQEENFDRAVLIEAIRNRKSHLILSMNETNTGMIKGLFQGTFQLDLDKYIEEVVGEIHAALLKQFEYRVKCLISPQAKEYFQEFIVKPMPHNFAAMEDFLALSASKSHGIDFPFQELSQETRSSGMLGRSFFRDIHEEWVGRSRTSTHRPILAPKLDQQREKHEHKHMLDLLGQLENLIQTFVKNEYKVSLYYSDQTRSLEEDRFLSRDQKIEELKTQLVVLLTSYQSSFEKWFDLFWGKIGPEAIRNQPGMGSSPKKLWDEYLARTNLIDTPYAVDHFHEVAARIFMEIWRSQKSGTRV